MNCEAASSFCSSEIMSPYFSTGLNYYDISKPCEDVANLCYSVTAYAISSQVHCRPMILTFRPR